MKQNKLTYGKTNIIGITGGVGAGKSAILEFLAQNYNARVITNQVCRWNDEEKLFMLGEDRYDIPFIFNVDVNEKDVQKMNVLTGGLKILDVKPLDVYDEDLTEGMKKKMMERLASEALG